MKQNNHLFDMGIKPGVYFDMPDTEYHKVPALSNSGIKNLLISPMDFWARSWMNPRYEHPETSAMTLGTAYHKRILEGKKAFDDIYMPDISADDYPDALRTVEEIKIELKKHGLKTTGKKSELTIRLLEDVPGIRFWDEVKEDYYSQDKIFLPQDEMDNIEYAAALKPLPTVYRSRLIWLFMARLQTAVIIYRRRYMTWGQANLKIRLGNLIIKKNSFLFSSKPALLQFVPPNDFQKAC